MLRKSNRKIITTLSIFLLMFSILLGATPAITSAEGTGAFAITTTSLPEGTIGASYSQIIATTGGEGAIYFSISAESVLPAGLTFDAITGLLSGTPTEAGNFTLTINATDSTVPPQAASQNYTLIVNPATFSVNPTQLTNTALPSFTFTMPDGVVFQNTAVAIVLTNEMPRTVVTALNLTNSGTAYQATGTQPISTAGAYLLCIFDGTPTAASKLVAYASFSITAALTITSSGLPESMIGKAFSHTIVASGGVTPLTFSLAAGSDLPNGLTLSETGLLSGTPTVVGSFSFTIEVRDSSPTPQLASQSFTLLVRPQPIKFDLNPSKLANGSVPSFSFTMPAGITFQNPAQALFASNGVTPSPIIPLTLTNTGTSYQAVGTAPINKSGEYILLIYDGIPGPGKMPVASGYFSVTPAWVSATPGSLKTGYPSGQSIIIQDVATANYWAASEINQVDIYKVTYPSPTTETETLVSTINSGIACTEADVVFTLPDNLSFGEYRIKLLTGSTVIAQASLMIFLPSIGITPTSLESNYPGNKTMTLQENTGDNLWSATDQGLNLKIFSINVSPVNVQKTFIADISSAALTLGTDAVSGADTIKFNPPVGLSPGEYLIQIFRDTNAIAACTFKVYTEDFNVNPDYIPSGYPNDFTINFDEANENVWTIGEENLFAQISQTEFDPFNGEKITPVGGKISLAAATIEETHITFPLPPCLDPGSYVIDLYRADSMIARGKLTIEVFQVGIDPNYVMDNYPSDQSVTLTEPSGLDLWKAADTLSVDVIQIIAAAGGGGGSPAPIMPAGVTGTIDETKKLITTISSESLAYDDDKNISFTLPSGLLSGEYKFVILRAKGTDNEVVGETTFGIFPASERLDINPYRVTLGSPVPVTLYEPVTQSSLWNAEDALQIQFYWHVPQTPWTPANFYPVANIVPGSKSDDEISFLMPILQNQGQYLVVVKRGDKQIAYSNLQVNPPIVELQTNPGNIFVGYKGQLQINLFNPSGACSWNPNDGVWARLLQYDKNNPGMWSDRGNIPTKDVTSNSLNVMLPEGLPAGQYALSINQYDVEIAYAMVFVQMLPMQANPGSFTAANPQPQEMILYSTPGMPVSWSTRDLLSYRLNRQTTDMDNPYDEICSGAVEHIPGYALSLQLPVGLEMGNYQIIIEKNGLDIACSYLTVTGAVSQVAVGECVSFKGAYVTVPVYGVKTQGASGAQFQLSFDPQSLSVVNNGGTEGDQWDVSTNVPGAYCSATVDTENGLVNVAIAFNEDITEDIVTLCEVKFQISATASNYSDIWIDPFVDEFILSDGINEIPTSISSGGVQLVQRGDVNNNDRVDVGDAVLVLRHLAGYTLSADRQKIGDVDGDTEIKLIDALYILERVVNKINKFPVE